MKGEPANIIPELTALGVFVLVMLAEWRHTRRSLRISILAFGPAGKARNWTRLVPAGRAVACALLSWGLLNLYWLDSRALKPNPIPEGGYRHLLIALDVSPSMQLKDAGPGGDLTRAQRASQILTSVLERCALDQMRVSIVAFYSGAKPVVVDTFDLEVVKNILNDLPLDLAFNPGKTLIIDGIKEAAALAKPWKEGSTTLLLVSDGDTVPDSGMAMLP